MKTQITLQLDNESQCDVLADVYGQWAAHVNTDGPGFRVSHVPTGQNIAQLVDELDEETAKLLAGELAVRVPEFETVDEMPTEQIMLVVAEVTEQKR